MRSQLVRNSRHTWLYQGKGAHRVLQDIKERSVGRMVAAAEAQEQRRQSKCCHFVMFPHIFVLVFFSQMLFFLILFPE